MSTQIAGVTDEVQVYIDKLKAKGADFAKAYQVHMNNYAKVKDNPALFKQWNSITTYANQVRDVIQTVNKSVDSGVNWLRDVFGLNGVGVLPAVPIVMSAAYLIAAITALTYVIGKIYEFNTLVNKGATTSELTQSGGMFSDITSLVKWGAIAYAAYLAWKKWGK